MAAVGSPAWVARTGGALSARDQLRFALAAVRREVGALSLRSRPGRVLDPERIPPDTRLATEIADLATAALPTPLLRHSLRTWVWGSLFAEIDGVRYDDERLYVAALLHDLALAEAHRPPAASACFAVHGGEVARSVMIEAGAENDFADEVADAIAAHFNVAVPLSWGAEVHLLHAGAHVDVVGLRLGELAPSTVSEVLRRSPRTGFEDCFLGAMREEARLRPRSRAALLWRLGMARSVRRTRFPAAVEVIA